MFQFLASLLLSVYPSIQPAQAAVHLPQAEVLAVHAPASLDAVNVPAISASGAMLIDVASGEVLYAKKPDTQRPMASLTKIMTALLTLEHHPTDDIVTVPAIADRIEGSTIGIKAGQHFRVDDMLKAMLLPSANDVAYALAVANAGSVSAFVAQMNARARSLGLKHTHFANPAGLDEPQQYSTPRDLAWLTLSALRHPLFRQIVSTQQSSVQSLEGTTYALKNTNEILHSQSNVFGVKPVPQPLRANA